MKVIRNYEEESLGTTGFTEWVVKHNLAIHLTRKNSKYVATLHGFRQTPGVYWEPELEIRRSFYGVGDTEIEACRCLANDIHGNYVKFCPPGFIPWQILGGW